MLKITTFTSALAATVATSGAIGIISAPITLAETTTQTIGSEGKLVDGNVIQAWTISDLKPSTDAIPYQPIGTLWEATATDEAIQGAATPIVSNLNARTQSGQTYRALFGVATPQGVNPATLGQGEETTGKVYFDVTGDKPESVVYNAGGQDLLVWVQPPPSPPRTGTRSSTPYQSASPATSAPATTTPAPAPAAAEATPAPTTTPVVPTPAPAGSQGTPLPPGSQGTPLPAGSQGAPIPAGSQGTPLPPGGEVAPVPPAPAGAPRPASIQGVPAPAAPAPVPAPEGSPMPAPEGSQGTPLAPGSEATPPLTEGTPVTPTPTTTPVPAP
jgi:hypothetical protein